MSGAGPKQSKHVTFNQRTPKVKTFQPENAPAVVGQGTRRKTKPKACGPRGQRPVAENTASVESANSSERNEESTINGSEEENTDSSVATENLENGLSTNSSVATENLENGLSTNGSEEESVVSNTNSEFSGTSDNSDLSVQSGPVKPIAGNPNLPSILFIGEGNVAEQLHLGTGSIQTMGGFNTHTLGDYKELQRLYGVKTPEEVEALQLAFGVSSLTKRSPPLKVAIEENCKQPYFPLVITLLANRIRSLQTSLNAMSNGLQKRGKVAFAKWLEDTVRTLKSIQTPCPAMATPAPGIGLGQGGPPLDSGSEDSDSVGSANTNERNTGGSSCHCLQDINLLRDLVYVVALLQGSTSPEVQAQIDRIGLQDILELAEGGNTDTALVRLKDVLETLKTVPDKVEAGSAEQEFINELYSKLTGTETAVDARKEDVLQEIDDLINLYVESTRDHEADVKELEAEKAELEARLAEINATGTNKNAEIRELTNEIDELEGFLSESEQEKATLLLQIPALTEQLRVALEGKEASNTTASTLKAQLKELQTQIADLTTKGAKAQANLRNAHAREIKELQDDHSGEITRLQTAIEAFIADTEARGGRHVEEVGQLEGQLKALQTSLASLQEKDAEIVGLQAQIAELQAEPVALKARLEEVNAELARLQAKEATNKNIDDANIALLAERMAKIVSLGAELKAVTTNRNAKATELDRLKGVETQLADKTAELARLTETHKAEQDRLSASLTGKNKALSAARLKLEQCETKADADGIQIAKLASLQAEVDAKQAEIEALKASGATATSGFEEAKRTLEAQMATLRTAKNGELAELKEQKNGEIDRLQKELTARNATIAEMERILTSKNAELVGIQAKANANVRGAQNTASASVAEAERKAKAEVEALTKQLADEKAAKEGLEEQLRTKPAIPPETQATLDKQTALIARLSAELEKRPKTDQLTDLEGQLTAMRASLEGKQLLTPEQITELQTHYLATYKEGAEKYILDMLASHKAELEARNAKIEELEKKPSAESLAELEGVLAEAKGASETKIAELTAKIAELESAKPPDTEERLNTLLGALILDDELRESAKTFMTTGEQSDLKTASKEMCEFFIYLKNVITLQMIEVNSTLAGYPGLQKDILQIFKKPPTFTKEENKLLLSEITAMFQEIFVKSAETTYPPAFELTGSYPTLSKLLTYDISDNRPLMYYTPQDQTKLTSLITTLKSLQIMNQHGIQPREDSKLYLQQSSKLPTEPFIVFSQQNTTHYTPIVIFAIKMLQLLKDNLNERTLKLKDICGL